MTRAITDEHRLVQQRLSRAYQQMAAGDIDGLMELYHEDALIQGAAQPAVAGRAAIRAYFLDVFERTQLRVEPHVEEVRVFGELFVVRGRALGVATPKSGGPAAPVDLWFHQIYRRQADGRLLFWRGANGATG